MLAPLLAALDNRRSEFLAGLASVPPEQRDRPPAAQAWSPLEIGEHLFRVEAGLARITTRQIDKGADRRRVGEPSEKSVEGLIQALRTPAKMKMPAEVEKGIAPTGEITYAELRERWHAAGEEWHAIAESLPPELEDEALVLHNVAGPLTTAQTLRFLEAHIEHHLHQLARTVRALNASPA
jgi:hypothetical protein